MSFRRIEVSGFKSFADRLDISFDQGITAIVGPNGCGKSNVADAIRWVLGEQSSKLLRGSSMQDVIFKGSEKRKGLSYCEVALVFDNTDRTFKIEYDEVVISRKLFRSGESEYAINRAPCRLKDIADLLHDSGVGRDGYSIIGQGKVEEIISSKPENRRSIFEEAAGIAKFKSRKVDAERKLERTHENLVRLLDIVGEIERQLNPLRKQAETARVYLSVKEELKILEVNNYMHQFEGVHDAKEQINERIRGYAEQVDLKQKQMDTAVSAHNEGMESIKRIDAEIDTLREDILELTVGLEKQAGEGRLIAEKLNHLQEQSTRIEEELTRAKADHQEVSGNLKSKQDYVKEQNELALKHRAQVVELEREYLKVIDELTAGEDEVDSKQRKMIDALGKLGDIKATLSRLEAEKAALFERETELKKRLAGLDKTLAGNEKQEQSALKLKNEANTKKLSLVSGLEAFEENLGLLEVKRREEQNKLATLLSEQSSLESRKKMLHEMQAEYEGYQGSVKRLLQDSTKNAALKNKIVGVVAELIKVPAQFETAIEMALGAAVQNVVTTQEDDAKVLVNYLKQNNLGRATFLPISSVKPRYISEQHQALLKSTGCFGVASDIISYDRKLDKVMRGLLGSTVIAENMDVAVKLAKQSSFSFRIVTLEGDVISPQGSITGGSKKATINNLLSREREIATIDTHIKKAVTDVEGQRKLIAGVDLKLENMDTKIKAETAKLHALELQLTKETSKYDEVMLYSEGFRKEREAVLAQLNQVTAKLGIVENELSTIAKQNSSLDVKGPTATAGIDKNQSRFDELKTKRERFSNQITDIKIQIATVETDVASVLNDIERLKQEQLELAEQIDENTSMLAKNTKTIEAAQAMSNMEVDKGAAQVDQKKLDATKARVGEAEEAKRGLQEKLAVIETERVQISQELSRSQEKLYQEEAKLGQIDSSMEAMQERIWEEYELTYETAKAFKQDDYDFSAGSTRIVELKKEISRLGYVNVNAIEDSQVLGERYEDLSTQVADLTAAEEDIRKIIDELATEMITRFETEFEKINTNFQRSFKELFGGGNARLVLTDSEDILAAGVDIIAEPPGKKLQNLTLLSGGEKALTAIAILFAILRLRPMPFCLLDEIEAALDDANVERFAKYLHRFAQETQFIVITHRKPTMELADSLYGVTMEEKGVSKIVSVKLSDAIKSTVAEA